MSNRATIGTTSNMIQPTTLRPALVRRSSSQRPRVGPRTRSYTGTGTGAGAGHSSRAPEQRHSASYAPRRDLNSMVQPSSRPSFMRALTAMNTSLNRAGASSRSAQPPTHDGPRRVQVVQSGPRGGTHRSEHTHASVVHASVAPARRSQRISSTAAAQDRRPSTATTHGSRPSTVVVHSRPSTAMVPHGHGHGPVEQQHHGHGHSHGHGPEQMHGSRGLVRVGGSRGGHPHH